MNYLVNLIHLRYVPRPWDESQTQDILNSSFVVVVIRPDRRRSRMKYEVFHPPKFDEDISIVICPTETAKPSIAISWMKSWQSISVR